MRADVREPEVCKTVVQDVVAHHGKIDYLVNNAGIMLDGPIDELSVDDWDAVIKVNLSGVFYLTRCVFPLMIEQRFGRIVNIGSTAGVTGSPARPNYSAAKAGLWGLTRSLARAADGIDVTANLVVVGPTAVGVAPIRPDPGVEALIARMPIGRRVRPNEVAHAVRFLVDDLAGAVTGSAVAVDGGITL
jgi:NAD(P)-dependent dehydrogenase (short-subunit alcohol dehydrogenase family)